MFYSFRFFPASKPFCSTTPVVFTLWESIIARDKVSTRYRVTVSDTLTNNQATSLIADAILFELEAVQLVARSTGNILETEKDWELISEFDKDEFLRQKFIRELWLLQILIFWNWHFARSNRLSNHKKVRKLLFSAHELFFTLLSVGSLSFWISRTHQSLSSSFAPLRPVRDFSCRLAIATYHNAPTRAAILSDTIFSATLPRSSTFSPPKCFSNQIFLSAIQILDSTSARHRNEKTRRTIIFVAFAHCD